MLQPFWRAQWSAVVMTLTAGQIWAQRAIGSVPLTTGATAARVRSG